MKGCILIVSQAIFFPSHALSVGVEMQVGKIPRRGFWHWEIGNQLSSCSDLNKFQVFEQLQYRMVPVTKVDALVRLGQLLPHQLCHLLKRSTKLVELD